MPLARYLFSFAILVLVAVAAQAQSCEACSYYAGGCYSAPTGVTGNSGCAPNYPPGSGCTYWGQGCSNGQQGPPTLADYCNFVNPGDFNCRALNPPYQIACLPTLMDQILGYAPTPGETLRLIRLSNGRLIVFQHPI